MTQCHERVTNLTLLTFLTEVFVIFQHITLGVKLIFSLVTYIRILFYLLIYVDFE